MKQRLGEALIKAKELEELIQMAIDAEENESLVRSVVSKTYELADEVALWGVDPADSEDADLCYCIEDEILPEESTDSSDSSDFSDPSDSSDPSDPEPKNPGKPVFSINDRFRFIRTLFDGNASEFNAALAEVVAMDSFDEAEEYFLGQLEWNPEDPEVEGFMKVVKSYFN